MVLLVEDEVVLVEVVACVVGLAVVEDEVEVVLGVVVVAGADVVGGAEVGAERIMCQ